MGSRGDEGVREGLMGNESTKVVYSCSCVSACHKKYMYSTCTCTHVHVDGEFAHCALYIIHVLYVHAHDASNCFDTNQK